MAEKKDEPSEAETHADQAMRRRDLAAARRLLEQAVAQTPARSAAWLKLASTCRALRDHSAGLAAVSRALEIDPLDFSALLARAALLKAAGHALAAGQAYGEALAQMPPEEQITPALRGVIAGARGDYAAFQEAQLARLEAQVPPLASEEEKRRLHRFCTNIARITRAFPQEPSHFHYPGLPAAEFHDRSRFPWLADLEAATPMIIEEYRAVAAARDARLAPYVQYSRDLPLRQWKELNHSERWTAIHLIKNGQRVEDNARRCPGTMALLETLPQPRIPDHGPNAMFSLLAPRTRIPPHSGVSNARLVCHLPLIVPPDCSFRVGAETRAWEPGRAFVFDDTIEHEARNDSDALRVVLIFDIWAWALSPGEREAVAAITAATAMPPGEGL
jgi:aspartyl/asparaginyl beta-hydroxylase (cupin superfamily)